MTYDELFEELFTMQTNEDFSNFARHLYLSKKITVAESFELWEMAVDILDRFCEK